MYEIRASFAGSVAVGAAAPIGARFKSAQIIRRRILSIKTVSKITNSMKMIANAKFSAARVKVERQRGFIESAVRLMQTEFPKAIRDPDAVVEDTDNRRRLVVVVTSDKGLCGAANSSVVKAVLRDVAGSPAVEDTGFVILGEKGKSGIRRKYSPQILWTVTEIGGTKKTSYADVCQIADRIVDTVVKGKYERVSLYYNHYINTVSMTPDSHELPSPDMFAAQERHVKIEFDSERDEILGDFWQSHLANTLYSAVVESQATELSSRMSAMDNATRNALDLADRLTIKMNRVRQASITTEISEIIGGAAAIADMEKDD